MSGDRIADHGRGSPHWVYRAALVRAAISGIVLPLAVACAVPPPGSSRPSFDPQAIDSIVEDARRQLRLPGVSLVIMRGQHVLVSRGYGLADRAAGVPATDSTIYPVASLSKQFTAAAIMRLVEDGRVKLDDPLARYFPEMALARDTTLRIEHLLRQTSGIEAWDDYPELQGIEATRDSGQFPLSRIIRLIGARPVLFAPGAWWSYSNSNFTLLAGVIERVTGLTYDQYLQQSLLVPLHLRSTASCSHQDASVTGRRRAVGYHVVADSLAVREEFAYVEPGMTGAGGLCSTAQDLARWMRALIDERAVSGASLRLMTSTRPVAAGFTPPYGFGLSLRPPLEEPAIWHVGVMEGFTALVAYLPTSDLVIAIVTNGRRVPIPELLRRLELQMTGRTPPVTRDLLLPAAEAKRDAGAYDDAMFKFRIVLDSGALFFDGPFGPPVRLFYQGGHDFVAVGPRAMRFSFRPDTGAVTLLVWDWSEIQAYGKPSHR